MNYFNLGITDSLLNFSSSINDETGIRNELTNTTLNRFSWEGNIKNLEWIEVFLLATNSVSIAMDSNYGLMLNPFVNEGGFNTFGYPYKIHQFNFFGSEYETTTDFEVMYDNITRFPTVNHIIRYAKKIKEIERTITACQKTMKAGIAIISKSNTEDLTYKTIANQLNQDNGFLFLRDESILDEHIKPFAFNMNYYGKDLENSKIRKYNEFYSLIGVNNANTQKAERLIIDEVNSNNDAILKNLNAWYKPRLDFCERVNKRFKDVNLKVTINDSLIFKDGKIAEV